MFSVFYDIFLFFFKFKDDAWNVYNQKPLVQWVYR